MYVPPAPRELGPGGQASAAGGRREPGKSPSSGAHKAIATALLMCPADPMAPSMRVQHSGFAVHWMPQGCEGLTADAAIALIEVIAGKAVGGGCRCACWLELASCHAGRASCVQQRADGGQPCRIDTAGALGGHLPVPMRPLHSPSGMSHLRMTRVGKPGDSRASRLCLRRGNRGELAHMQAWVGLAVTGMRPAPQLARTKLCAHWQPPSKNSWQSGMLQSTQVFP